MPKSHPMMIPRGNLRGSIKMAESTTAGRKIKILRLITCLRISIVTLLKGYSQQIPESRGYTKDQKYNRKPGKGIEVPVNDPVAYGESDKGADNEVDAHSTCYAKVSKETSLLFLIVGSFIRCAFCHQVRSLSKGIKNS